MIKIALAICFMFGAYQAPVHLLLKIPAGIGFGVHETPVDVKNPTENNPLLEPLTPYASEAIQRTSFSKLEDKMDVPGPTDKKAQTQLIADMISTEGVGRAHLESPNVPSTPGVHDSLNHAPVSHGPTHNPIPDIPIDDIFNENKVYACVFLGFIILCLL